VAALNRSEAGRFQGGQAGPDGAPVAIVQGKCALRPKQPEGLILQGWGDLGGAISD
jgi:hypothetical protein